MTQFGITCHGCGRTIKARVNDGGLLEQTCGAGGCPAKYRQAPAPMRWGVLAVSMMLTLGPVIVMLLTVRC